MDAVIQTLTGMLGAVGFSMLFNVRGRKLAAAAVGSVLSWSIYLLLFDRYEDKVLSLFFATITVAVLSEILARVMKAPVIILLVPMLVPLLPGGDLFYTTSNLVQGNTQECLLFLGLVVKEAGAISFGVILVTCFVQVIMKIYRHFKS